MINNSTQRWEVGESVKVGFMTLTVKAKIGTPGDFRPDAYIMMNAKGDKFYAFIPHNGLRSIDADDAIESIRSGNLPAYV